jgi:isopentenyl-diphosphate delta-isomerase type 1
VYRDGQGVELLLQQRAETKYHAGGLWSNTCCSHPMPGESLEEAGERRLLEELGFSLPLTLAGSFIYQHHFDNGLIEYEFDYVMVAHAPQTLSLIPNPEEVMNTRWISLVELYQDLSQHPEHYTPWFSRALAIATK